MNDLSIKLKKIEWPQRLGIVLIALHSILFSNYNNKTNSFEHSATQIEWFLGSIVISSYAYQALWELPTFATFQSQRVFFQFPKFPSPATLNAIFNLKLLASKIENFKFHSPIHFIQRHIYYSAFKLQTLFN